MGGGSLRDGAHVHQPFGTGHPRTDHTPTKYSRNEEIRARYAAGETIGYLAQLFDISEQRISQIVQGKRK